MTSYLTTNMSIFFDDLTLSTLTRSQSLNQLTTTTILEAQMLVHLPTNDDLSAKDAKHHDEPTTGVTPESLVTAVTPTTSPSYRHVKHVGNERTSMLPDTPIEVPN